MTESSTITDTRSDQQTIPEAIRAVRRRSSEPEVFLRAEPDGRYLRFARDVDRSLSLMVNYSDAQRVLEERGGFEGVLEHRHRLSITGTEENEKVAKRDRWSVIDFLEKFDREILYIPDWGWVSSEQGDVRQSKAIGRYVDRVEWLWRKIEDFGLPVTLRPLAKGLNGSHFREAAETYQRLGIEDVAIYGVETPSNSELVRRTEQAILALDPESVMVIGRGSPRQVREFPKRVDSIASWRNWTKTCEFSADYYSEVKLDMWFKRNKLALKQGHELAQMDLEQFDGARREVMADG